VYPPSKSVQLTTLCSAESVAVTVAPGIGIVPDLTAPEITMLCDTGIGACAKRQELRRRKAKVRVTVGADLPWKIRITPNPDINEIANT
jgi:hypothetical protein